MNSKICSVCCFLSTSQRTDVFRLSVQISVHVGKLNLRSAYHGFLRQECHVRCQQCIFRMKQRFLCGNGRLTVKYIHRSSCDPSFVQSLCQCLAVYDRASCAVNENGGLFIRAIFSALIMPLVSLLFGVCREIISHSLNRSSSGLYAIPAAFTSSLSCLA